MTFLLVVLSGVLVSGGLLAIAASAVRPVPRLELALARVGADDSSSALAAIELGPTSKRSERLGATLYRHSPFPLTEHQRQALTLQDKSIAEFYSDKAVMAVVGAFVPTLVAYALGSLGHGLVVPALLVVMGAAVGFFVPDLLLRRNAKGARSRAVEALLVYIDLVTLERLANASATQALQNAAALSEVPVFAQIRAALERAQLEQQSPYAELRRLADRLDLPELTDVADVMQLDETGAALSGALRARVRELRDAHLTVQQVEASATAEGMTLYMTLPALIFGLIFLVPPLMTIALG